MRSQGCNSQTSKAHFVEIVAGQNQVICIQLQEFYRGAVQAGPKMRSSFPTLAEFRE